MQLTEPKHSTRRKIFYIPEHFLVTLFSEGLSKVDYVSIPDKLGLPDGTIVCGMFMEHDKRSIAFIIQHDSFDPVATGCRLPELPVNWNTITLIHP